MRFTFRSTRFHDLAAMTPLIRGGFFYDAQSRAQLPAFWRALLESGAAQSAVVEDEDAPAARRVAGFAFSVFVSDEFLREMCVRATPDIALEMQRRWQAGRLPILSRPEIARANGSDGLSLLILHYGCDDELEVSPAFYEFSEQLTSSFPHEHGGYRLREILQPIFGDESYRFCRNCGYHLRADYADYFRDHTLPPPRQRPYLVGVTRAETVAEPGCKIGVCFFYSLPRFGFKPGEQTLLLLALREHTDGEIAAILGVSPVTVKKRWAAIYLRVAEIDAALLPANGEAMPINLPGAPATIRRGLEKRRHLLSYLRQHPEELRPISPAPRPLKVL